MTDPDDREREFFELMQTYRTLPLFPQADVIKAYEAVKAFIAAEHDALIARVRLLEAACLYLYRTWEGEGDAKAAVFGIEGDEYENGAPAEIQAALRSLLSRGPHE